MKRFGLGWVVVACLGSTAWASPAPDAVSCKVPTALPESGKPHWTYAGGEEPPAAWGELAGYETCGTGNAQTPIDIATAGAVAAPGKPSFRNYGKIPLVIEQNGHTVQVDYTAKNDGSDPQFDYGGKTYVLLQFHLHAPSEHHLDGRSFAGELHMVHKAADGSLAVVGVFLEEGAANPELAKVLASAPPARTKTSCDAVTIDLATIVPTNGTLWSYAPGSLTTPPCTEGLTWFVSGTAVKFSKAQHDAFVAKTSASSNRPIQPLNHRTIQKLSLK